MAGQTVTIDGHSLNDLFHVRELRRGVPEFEPTTIDLVDGGAAVTSMRMGTAQVSLDLVVLPGVKAQDAVSTLLSWLDTGDVLTLQVSGTSGRALRVVANGAPTIEDYEYEDVVTVELLQVDPSLHGDEHNLSMTGTTTFTVGGDCPIAPTISCQSATRRASDDLWGLSFDDGEEEIYVKIASPLATEVVIDCDRRVVTMNGDPAMITLESDWPRLRPGNHKVAFGAGSGTTVITWHDRWHR